jgi:PPOX class probable F420-dependent enzyme
VRVRSSPFPNLPRRKRFVSVGTYRRSGSLVATPLWFGWSDRGIVVVTPAGVGKLKRLRHDNRVTVAPCRGQGRVTGPTAPGHARILDGSEASAALRAIARRYPVPRALLERTMRRRGGGHDPVYIEITP